MVKSRASLAVIPAVTMLTVALWPVQWQAGRVNVISLVVAHCPLFLECG